MKKLRMFLKLYLDAIPKEELPRKMFITSQIILFIVVPSLTLFMHLGGWFCLPAAFILIWMTWRVWTLTTSMRKEIQQIERACQVARRLRGLSDELELTDKWTTG